MDFKDEMRTVIIPSVERMIEKEKVHLATLQAVKARIRNMSFLRRLFFNGSTSHKVDEFITNSTNSLKHLETRLKEYKEFI